MCCGRAGEGPRPAGRAVTVSSGPQHPLMGRSPLEHCLGVCSSGPLGGVPAEGTGGHRRGDWNMSGRAYGPGSTHSLGTAVRVPRSPDRLGLPEPQVWLSQLCFMGEGSPERQQIQDPRSHPEHHPSPPTSHQDPLTRCRSRAGSCPRAEGGRGGVQPEVRRLGRASTCDFTSGGNGGPGTGHMNLNSLCPQLPHCPPCLSACPPCPQSPALLCLISRKIPAGAREMVRHTGPAWPTAILTAVLAQAGCPGGTVLSLPQLEK